MSPAYLYDKTAQLARPLWGGADIDLSHVDLFTLYVTEPTAANTGFRIPEANLTNYAGSLTNVKAGETVSGLAITGNVEPYNSGGTYRDCLILMGASPFATGIEYPAIRGLRAGVTDNLFEFCTVAPSVQTVDIYGPQGGGFTLRRCDVSGVVDGLHINGLSSGEVKFVRAEGCYIHDLVSYTVDPRQGGGHSHNDGIQAAGYLDLEVVGSAIHGGFTSAILLQQGLGTYTKALIDRNWLYGDPTGGACLNITENGRGPINNLSVTGNRFGGKTTSLVPTTTYNAATTVFSGNVDMTTGQPISFFLN